MEQNEQKQMLNPYVSVDCVLLGIDDNKMAVLLTERLDEQGRRIGYKLPGSLIFEQEDLDDAAQRVMAESTGLKQVIMKQFHCFGSPLRTANSADIDWLEKTIHVRVSHVITVAYLALCRRTRQCAESETVRWFPVSELPPLPFDHPEIIQAALNEIRTVVEKEPAILFGYLPAKFTAAQLRKAYEVVYGRELDVRNFHKKMNSLDYIQPTDEREDGVAHRAARFYRFDKVKYNTHRSKFR